jgi:ribitol 2-dehydrogenase
MDPRRLDLARSCYHVPAYRLPAEKLKEAKETGSLLEAADVGNVILFMLTRPRGMTIRHVVMMPTNFDL